MEFPKGFRERNVQANGIRVRLVTGTDETKPPLLMLHGIYDRAEGWLPVADALARNFWLIMPDLRGHHQSEWPDRGYQFSDYAADAAGVLDALKIDTAIVLGHSLGALITMVLAGESPDRVRSVVLEDPPSQRSEDTRTWLGALLTAKNGTPEQTYVAMQGMHPEKDENEWRREADWLRNTADGPFLALAEPASTEPDSFATTIDRISGPVLLMQADPRRGAALSTEDARRATIDHENCRLVTFPGSGHTIHQDLPEKFVGAVTGFLRDIDL
jgi:pimeloyl-ACP methyl ester carboxylesterase